MSPRILLVDDHPLLRRGVRQALLEAWPEAAVEDVGSTAEALALLAAAPWDLVVLDLAMPGRDGLSLLEDLRGLHPGVPALVLSSHPEEELALRCLRLGAAGYVAKAAAAGELVDAVRRVLAGGKHITPALADQLARVYGGDLPRASHEALSTRELQVLRLTARGRSVREVAAELGLSEKTVGTYRARIAAKLGLSTGVELARYALKNGLVD